jgi:hypothetical protein
VLITAVTCVLDPAATSSAISGDRAAEGHMLGLRPVGQPCNGQFVGQPQVGGGRLPLPITGHAAIHAAFRVAMKGKSPGPPMARAALCAWVS